MSFLLTDISVDNLLGSGEFGFNGEGNTIKFRFEEGNVFDFDDVNIYSYQVNSKFSILGDISSSNYSYTINDYLFSQDVGAKTKSDFKLE